MKLREMQEPVKERKLLNAAGSLLCRGDALTVSRLVQCTNLGGTTVKRLLHKLNIPYSKSSKKK